jgi:hypothetical protein
MVFSRRKCAEMCLSPFFQGFPATAGSKYLDWMAGNLRRQLHRYLHRLKPAETGRQ